ncbi:hypothetical protein GCM10022261_18880 [Brevibacterium daeguense]|uniref:Acyl-CoA dehydrogenase n=1 Tax=Brevibacterium daeguense TaxID=909936 RepID=A0ABP8EK86_9MICO|nr:acyl-CoA dehydrogenase family protein [Brevibacterium daeguense]
MSSNEIRTRIRAFLDERLASGAFAPKVDCWLRSVDHDFSRDLGAAGFLGMTWPTEHGGAGRPNTDRLALTEELLRVGAPVTAHWIAERQIGPAVLRAGTEQLKADILPDIIAGRAVIGLGMSEPEAGSDLASVKTRAVPAEGGWILNGHKIWTTQAHNATAMYILARTSVEDKKHQGLSEFIIDMDSPGIEVSPIVDLAGEHHFNEVRYTDVFIPADRLIGTEGEGWKQVIEQLSFERGGPERALSTWVLMPELLAEEQLRTDEGAQRDLGQMVATLAGLRHMYRRIAAALDAGQAPIRLAAASKYLGNTFEKDLIDVARRLVPCPSEPLAEMIQQALWASPAFGIRGGAEDVLLGIVAKLELPRDLSKADPEPKLADPDAQELIELAARVAGGSLLEVNRTPAGTDRMKAVVEELGWTRVSIPETAGGSGGTLTNAATIVRGLARLGVTAELPEHLLAAHEGNGLAGRARDALAALLDAAVLIGAAEGALALTTRHVIEREQFGAPLATIPAVKTWIARMRMQLDLAIEAFDRALEITGETPEAKAGDAEVAAAFAAKAIAAQAGGLVAAQSHQLHGGIGITAEYPLHHLTQLIWARRDTNTTEHQALVALGSMALAGGEPVIWDVLTDSAPRE